MITVMIYRPGVDAPVLAAKPNDNSSVTQTIMGDHFLTLQIYLDRMVELRIGDYADVYGNRYYVHGTKLPVVTKNSTYGYQYDFQMLSTQYLLQNAQYLFLGSDNTKHETAFSIYGTAEQFVDLLIANANRTGITWKKGGVVQTEYKNLSFSGVNCFSALGTLAEQFNTEWFVDGNVINLAKKLNQKPFIFKYGKGKGMYDIKRQPADSTSIVTRLYAFGGTQNIPGTYRNGSTRLLLPAIASPQLISNVIYSVTNNGNGTETIFFKWTKPKDATITRTTANLRLTSGNVTTFSVYESNNSFTPPTSIITVPVGTYEVFFQTFSGSAVCFDF